MLRMLVWVVGLSVSAAMPSGLVVAGPQVPNPAGARTDGPPKPDAAKISIEKVELRPGRFNAEVTVETLTGSRLPPCAAPCRAWLHVTVRDRYGLPVFESGAPRASGAIQGNDGDLDPKRLEPRYTQITSADQVQIYESVPAAGGAGSDVPGERDTVRYSVPVLDALSPFEVFAELWYQPMAARSAAGPGVMLVRATASTE